MSFEDLLSNLKQQFQSSKPFVAYRKPKSSRVKVFLQSHFNHDTLTSNNQSGFVFAPFDNSHENVFFNLESCDVHEVVFNKKDKTSRAIITSPSNSEKSRYINLIENSITEIKESNLRKVVISRAEGIEIDNTDQFEIFQGLLQNNHDAFVYLMYHPKVGIWIGATPENLMKVDGTRFSTMSLAGTKISNEINWTKKEFEEQQIVTDFLKENLKEKVSDIKSFEAESVSTGDVVHLKTTITGTIDSDKNELLALIEKIHPTPAVCGVPKDLAKMYILNNENYPREFYTGYLGEFNLEITQKPNRSPRNMENRAYFKNQRLTDLYVNLRCLKLEDNMVTIYVGGGITALSNPEEEWQETVNKTLTIKKILV